MGPTLESGSPSITTLIFADAFSKSLHSVDEKSMELRESILRILSKNGGHPFSAQELLPTIEFA
jgi:Fe2+ or Zn2+ uptake regulation protein